MAIHQMRLSLAPFGKIEKGKKVIESRLYDEKRQQINVGDEVIFVCEDSSERTLKTKVTDLYRYKTFEELFSAFSPKLFGGESREQLVEEIRSFYPQEKEQQYGVVGIRIEIEK